MEKQQRQKLTVKVTSIRHFETKYGPMYLSLGQTSQGQSIVHKGKRPLVSQLDMFAWFEVEAQVHENEWQGEPQLQLKRPKFGRWLEMTGEMAHQLNLKAKELIAKFEGRGDGDEELIKYAMTKLNYCLTLEDLDKIWTRREEAVAAKKSVVYG